MKVFFLENVIVSSLHSIIVTFTIFLVFQNNQGYNFIFIYIILYIIYINIKIESTLFNVKVRYADVTMIL